MRIGCKLRANVEKKGDLSKIEPLSILILLGKIMAQKEEDLIANKNIFALFVLANFYVNKTRKELRTRLKMKEKLFELAMERGIPKEKIGRLIFFIDNIMIIPVDLQEEFDEFVNVKLIRNSAKHT